MRTAIVDGLNVHANAVRMRQGDEFLITMSVPSLAG